MQPSEESTAPKTPFLDNARRIARLAWPVFIGQLSVLAFSTIDTVLVARFSSQDLAALAVGAATYVTVFVGFMGVVLAIGPIAGQLYGAGRLSAVGRQVHQGIWIALLMSIPGSLLLLFPHPFLMVAQLEPAVEAKALAYLRNLAWALPASMLFTVFRGFGTAISRPQAVMVLQLSGLAAKVPLSMAFLWGVPALGIPSMGVAGCALATAVSLWLQCIATALWVRRDADLARFELLGRGLDRPHRGAILGYLRLGVPMGGAILIEVTGFTLMAIFIARLGTTPVAGHQIAANLVALLFMMPLSLANATSTLVAQQVGAQRLTEARRLGWHGVALGFAVALLMGGTVLLLREPVVGLYTRDAAIMAAALPLVAWVMLFHLSDATQTMAVFVLRAYRIATVPMLIYVTALWGVGLGGGFIIAFDPAGWTPADWPQRLRGPEGFWLAATSGLALAAVALTAFLAWMQRQVPPAARR